MTLFIRTIFTLVLLLVVGGAITVFWNIENRLPTLSYNEFLTILDKDEVTEVRLQGSEIALKDTFGREFATYSPDIAALLPKLLDKGVIITGGSDNSVRIWRLAELAVPVMLILLVWYSLLRNQAADYNESEDKDKHARFAPQAMNKLVTFRDVAGVPEAKEELLEVIDFLQRPKKYSRLGAVIPRGILFPGPAGNRQNLDCPGHCR